MLDQSESDVIPITSNINHREVTASHFHTNIYTHKVMC